MKLFSAFILVFLLYLAAQVILGRDYIEVRTQEAYIEKRMGK